MMGFFGIWVGDGALPKEPSFRRLRLIFGIVFLEAAFVVYTFWIASRPYAD